MRNLIIAGMVLLALVPAASGGRAEVGVEIETRGAEVFARAEADAELEFEWDWGDGEVSAGASASHRYRVSGDHEVVLKVRDEGGRCWTERRLVTVSLEREGGREREDDGGSRRSASVSASIGGGSVEASLAYVRERSDRDAEDDASWRAQGEVETHGRSGKHREVPGPAAALLVLGLAALALVVRRR